MKAPPDLAGADKKCDHKMKFVEKATGPYIQMNS